jgi:hypothetical protein
MLNLAQTIYEKSLSLPPEKAQAVIDFIDFIQACPNFATEKATKNSNQTEPKPSFSERWRGKFSPLDYTSEALAEDPQLAYLAEKYLL